MENLRSCFSDEFLFNEGANSFLLEGPATLKKRIQGFDPHAWPQSFWHSSGAWGLKCPSKTIPYYLHRSKRLELNYWPKREKVKVKQILIDVGLGPIYLLQWRCQLFSAGNPSTRWPEPISRIVSSPFNVFGSSIHSKLPSKPLTMEKQKRKR